MPTCSFKDGTLEVQVNIERVNVGLWEEQLGKETPDPTTPEKEHVQGLQVLLSPLSAFPPQPWRVWAPTNQSFQHLPGRVEPQQSSHRFLRHLTCCSSSSFSPLFSAHTPISILLRLSPNISGALLCATFSVNKVRDSFFLFSVQVVRNAVSVVVAPASADVRR